MADLLALFANFRCSFTDLERKLISELYPIIKKTIEDFVKLAENKSKRYYKAGNCENVSSNIKVYKEKIDRIVRILDSSDEKRDQFLNNFPIWKEHRVTCIGTLQKMVFDLRDIRQSSNIVRIASGTLGFLGGTSIVLSSLLAPATAGASLAAAGVICAVGGAAGTFGTSVTELVLTDNSLSEAKRMIERDAKLLERLGVFEFLNELNSAVDDLFNNSTSSKILNDLVEFLRQIPPSMGKVQPYMSRLKACLDELLPKMKDFLIVGYPLAAFILSITFVVFMIRREGCAFLKYSVALGLVRAVDASAEITRLVATASLSGSALSGNLLGSITVGALAGVGIALDVATVVINTIELSRGACSDEVKLLNTVVIELQTHLSRYQDLYNDLAEYVKRRLRRRKIFKWLLSITLVSMLTGSLYINLFQ